ncbi:hypothetical protein T05_6435 [Trichinella murrelli]|uniref:Uncharacterized protein n=1 Tax=Trichinella murrelli TaxID=144512 RepID=A0A0V0U9C0_9BILA|nr:hypothetical protein T05_6435 [Trichinella murrelli]
MLGMFQRVQGCSFHQLGCANCAKAGTSHHMQTCPVDHHLAYKLKKGDIKKANCGRDEIWTAGNQRSLGTDGTFTILPEWYQQLFTSHAITVGKDIDTYGKVGELGLETRYQTEEETKIKMLLATAFIPVPQVDMGVSQLELSLILVYFA